MTTRGEEATIEGRKHATRYSIDKSKGPESFDIKAVPHKCHDFIEVLE